jgi:hypothetical protein
MTKKAIMMDPQDNVATALNAITAGDEVEIVSSKQEVVRCVKAKDSLPFGHKIALAEIKRGAEVRKYGIAIGSTLKEIALGEYVHIHNMNSNRLPLTKHMLGEK